MAVLNPTFAEAGNNPGEAAHWRIVSFAKLERIAGFGPMPYGAIEDFERWFAFSDDFSDVTSALAFFDQQSNGFEDFETGWQNNAYLTELPTGHLAILPLEDFNAGWETDDYETAWAEITAFTALFDGMPNEAFEQGWRENLHYLWTWEGALSESCIFDSTTNTTETFSGEWPEATTQ